MTKEEEKWLVEQLRSIETIDRNDFVGERHINEVHNDIIGFVEELEDDAFTQGRCGCVIGGPTCKCQSP